MRILIAGQTYAPCFNGQSIFTINLAEGLACLGHEVMVVVPSYQGKASLSQHNGVQTQSVSAINLKFLHPDVYLTMPADAVARQVFDYFQPDVAHVQDHYPISGSVLKIARRRNIKAIGTNHFMPENLAPYFPLPFGLKSSFEATLWQWMLRFFNRLDVVTAPSKTAAAILRRRGLRVPVYPISCGVDLSRFHWDASVDRSATRQRYGLAPDRCMFLFVGRVDGEKRLDVLLHALALLKRDDIQLAIAGKGAALKGLKALARALKLGDRVRFLGFVPDGDLPALLNSADIFTMPSEAELLSIATLEAMACGRPLLVAQAEALPELVTPGVNGYLFQPGNPVDAARHMALLAAQPLRWASMGAASLDKVQHHSLENTVSSYEKIYESLSLNHPLPNLYTVSPARRLASKRKRQTVTEFWR